MSRTRQSVSQSGFTLVEMLVALLLFSIIATIATAMTGSATRSFAATETALASISDLEAARALLAADLGQAAPRTSIAADGAPMPAFMVTGDGFVLVRARPDGMPAVEKVAWGLVDGRLLRQPFPSIDGAPPGQPVVIAQNVAGISLRVAGERGWQDGWNPANAEELPRALEVTLFRSNGAAVTMKFLVAG